MKTNDMNPEERLALGSLVRVMVRLDGELSSAESNELGEVARQLGEEGFWAAIDEAGQDDLSDDAVMARARAVLRTDARETIYAALAEIAKSGSVVDSESSLLDWLTKEWGLEPRNAPEKS